MQSSSSTIFGTDGIRKRVGVAPLSPDTLPQLGYATGLWAQQKYGSAVNIIIAQDTRESCDEIKMGLARGLLAHTIMLSDAGVLPTPATYLLAKNDSTIHCAIVISASHNPYYDNGIKIIDAKTGKISAEDEALISAYYYDTNAIMRVDAIGTMRQLEHAQQTYADMLIARFPKNLLAGKKIIIDCAHGATYQIAPLIFKALGADLTVINAQPSGQNINDTCGATDPQQLQAAVLAHNADMGFAFDGDGDRVTVVSSVGEIKDGDDILAMLMTDPTYASEQVIVGTIMSNCALSNFAAQNDKHLACTNVGDKHVVRYMKKHNCILGGEPSGHIIMTDYLDSSDGIYTALRLVQALQVTYNWAMHSFTHYPQVIINMPVTEKKDLTKPEIQQIFAMHEQLLKGGRIIVRYSGTENILRIMVEDSTHDNSLSLAHSLADAFSKQLS